MRILCLLLIALQPVWGGVAPPANASPTPQAGAKVGSFIRVNSNNQTYDFGKPWTKRAPFSRRGLGVVLEGQRVLVTAELVANHNFVEFELPGTNKRSPATVETVDYESNLALLKPSDPGFLKDFEPLALAPPARVGSTFQIVQMESTGEAALTSGTITTITQGSYPVDDVSLLIYKLSASLQYRDGSFTLPALFEGKLGGMLIRYDARSQTADLVPSPVIRRFLENAKDGKGSGFSRLGVGFAPTRDPQLRSYLGLPEDNGGVLVTEVLPGSSAAQAGIEKGDVVLSVAGNPVDADGMYVDKDFGKLPVGHLISTVFRAGDKVPVHVFRNKEEKWMSVTLAPRDPTKMISRPYLYDEAPKYFVLGGLVLQELSQTFLREWGNDWRREAPQRLVYLDEFQEELPKDRGHIVFISQILPGELTLGYEEITYNVVTKINGQEIRSLQDAREAAKHPVGGYQVIETEEDPGLIFLDAEGVEAIGPQLEAEYGIPKSGG